MMKNLYLAFLLAGTMATAAAPVSAGSNWGWSWLGACGGNSFTTCMSGSISYSGGNSLTVNVTNATPYVGDIFTAVGLFNLPAGLTPTITGPTNWSVGNNYTGINGPIPDFTYAMSSNQGINNGFGDGQTRQFTFTFANQNTAWFIALENTVGVGIHAQRGPLGCSAKMGVANSNGGPTGEAINNFDAVEAAKCVSVPEPESMALLATGIAGLLFVAARRRKGLELVDEDGNEI